MKTRLLYSLISSSLVLTACGGGGGGSTALQSTYLLKGTVPGTQIEAYCDDGSTYSTVSTKNGTSNHPFELKLPQKLACRVVMITNENDPANKVITPIKFMDKNGKSSIAITSNDKDIEVGHIDLKLSRSDMDADDNGDGVEDIPKEIIVLGSTIVVVSKTNDPLDKDNDGIINVYEDDDGDKTPNHDDDDDDGDGIKDINDNDHNNDGISDNDLDGDGVDNGKDVDDDNDGLKDSVDDDDDNDGIKDVDDNDDDNDGVNDQDDADDRNENENENHNENDDR